MKGVGYMGEVRNKPPVEVDKAHEGLDLSHIFWGWPLIDSRNLDGVHLYMAFR